MYCIYTQASNRISLAAKRDTVDGPAKSWDVSAGDDRISRAHPQAMKP